MNDSIKGDISYGVYHARFVGGWMHTRLINMSATLVSATSTWNSHHMRGAELAPYAECGWVVACHMHVAHISVH